LHNIAFLEICPAFFGIPDSYGRSVRESKIVGISELRFHTRIPCFQTALHAAHIRRQLVCAFLFLPESESAILVFQTRGPTTLHWHARRAPMECLLGPCGATPLERHCAELTVHGVEVNTPAIPRLDPVLTPRHPPRKRLSQDTASPATDPRPADDILFPPSRTRISRAWRWTPTTIRCS